MFNREINYKNTLRNYNKPNHSHSNSMNNMNFTSNKLYQSCNSSNNNIIYNNNNKNNDHSNLPRIENEENKKNFTLIKNKNVIKEANLLNFIHSKQKIKHRLRQMSLEKMNMSNNSFGQRILIKDAKNTIIDDGLSKTLKKFNNMNNK